MRIQIKYYSVQTRCIVKGEAQKNPLFWRFSGGFWFSQDRLLSRNSTRKPLNLIKSPIFTNTPCKPARLYNAPSMHSVDKILQSAPPRLPTGLLLFLREELLKQHKHKLVGPNFLRTFLTLTPGCPGVKKFLPTTRAAGKHTFWCGHPRFLVQTSMTRRVLENFVPKGLRWN